jgi:hypothetical protein
MGCSPYFAVTGSHPLIPLNISKATYLQPPPDSILSTTDLIARRAIALQKRSQDLANLYSNVYTAHLKAAKHFKLAHQHTMRDYNFERGDLALLRNTQIEKALNRKMRPQYLSPLIVIARNYGRAYILCKLDGTIFHRPIAVFRLLPYLARKSIPLPPNFTDIDSHQLEAIRRTTDVDDDIIEGPHDFQDD